MSQLQFPEDYLIKIEGIDILSLTLKSKPEGYKGVQYNFDFEIETKIQEPQYVIVTFTRIEVREQNKEEILADAHIAMGFRLQKEGENILGKAILKDEKRGLWNVPEKVSLYLNNITISTLRGVLYTRFQGTYLSGAIIPVIPSTVLLPKSESKL